ncbi:MAG: rhodanese-like domain-containing protein [Deltaproteobacteria bacterium]|nr:rhodanese-like domain-containing protein [Deltaproteobacteria bacterium]
MRKSKLVLMALTLVFFLPFCASAAAADPFVTPDWLEKNLSAPNTVIVDIRKMEEYREGHVPNAISIFYNSWAVTKSGLGNEIPADDDLRDLLGGAGIGKDTTVVIVNKADPFVERVNMTRVAWTLKYAGVQNVAILNGGYDAWVAAKKEISKTVSRGNKVAYDGQFNKGLLVDKAQVLAGLGKAKIVDTRELPFYAGEKKLDFVAKPGHIKGAVHLPTFQIFKDISFKSKDELAAMALPVVGEKRDAEIIVYCDSGRVASAWWYILSQVLGYTHVKNYDGSAQDWTKDPAGPVEP